ncbi:MAG TPA: hypothetical protein VEB86_04830, partial [Chryseosolibacter sp.]|nr:hypothetical protein [Chryseosolibacter sp.]
SEHGALRQRDLEYLAEAIEKQSGVRLSLSTLKRLWKKDYGQTPHPSTLDALVSVLGCRDWQEFRLQAQPGEMSQPAVKRGWRPKRWMVWPALAITAIVFVLIALSSAYSPKTKPIVKGPIIFKGNKTVSQGVPNTIIFNYDLSNVEADSFFFQQSWNEEERVAIDPAGHYYSAIYYYPGFHKAKLIANDSVLTRFRVHITTDGWMPLVRYSYTDSNPLYLKKRSYLLDGTLHVTASDLEAAAIDMGKEFVLSYYNVREFSDIQSDNFSLTTRVRCDSSNTPCPGFEAVVICEAHIFFVRMMGKGCERNTGIKMGEVYLDGGSNDLSALGSNIYEWQDLKITVNKKHATVYVGEREVRTVVFKEDFGKVVGLVYNFGGTGAVDHIKLENGDGQLVYQDSFE